MAKKITIRNIKHIRHLEFNLPSRSGVYTLTGSNGSGKTTLVKILVGQLKPDEGKVKIGPKIDLIYLLLQNFFLN